MPTDSVKTDPNVGAYSVKLDYGNKYRLMVNGANLIPIPAELDLSTETNYREINLDLFADSEKAQPEPIQPLLEKPVGKTETIKAKKFASIRGRIIDKRTGDPFPSGTKLQVKVMGSSQPGAHIDQQAIR